MDGYHHPQDDYGYNPQANLGATFYPGGVDDYYMPEVVSPAPQRPLQEVPEQMHQQIVSMARIPRTSSAQSVPTLPIRTYTPQTTSIAPSPFPPLDRRPPNVPPSNEEKEQILENACVAVLNSNDPEMQLVWAQDVLVHVDICIQHEQRISEIQPARPKTPPIERQLRTDAVNIVTFLAEQRHPKADFMRGKWLEFGKFGSPLDLREAYRCYSRAAQNGYYRAEYRMGMQFESAKEISKAIPHYQIGTDHGDAASSYRLGMMALLGQYGQLQDYAHGIDLIRFSAENADEDAPQGAYIYGMLLARELHEVNIPEQYLPQDLTAARIHIENAAFLGFAKAQTKMGSAYEMGTLGCHFDPVLSLHYNNLAARQSEPEAEMAISKWFLCGHEGAFRKNEDVAFAYAYRAANSGLATAEFAMGYFFEVGIGAPVDIQTARSWYVKAANHGNADAASRVEGISRAKTLSRKDHNNIALARIHSQHANHPPPSDVPPLPPMPPLQNPYLQMPDRTSYASPGQPIPYSPISPQVSSPSSVYSQSTNDGFRPLSIASTISNRPLPDPHRNDYPPNKPSNGYTNGPPQLQHRTSNTQRPPIIQAPSSYAPQSPQPYINSPNLTSMRPPTGLPSSPRPPQHSTSDPYINNNNQNPFPPIQLGFVAPLDPTGADRPRRPQRNDDPRPQGPPANSPSHLHRPSHRTSSAAGHGQYHDSSTLISSSSSRPSSIRPSRTDSASLRPSQSSTPVSASSGLAGGRPGGNSSTSASTLSRPSAATSTSTAAAATGKKPGKGPATFEEMGVPAGKNDGECVTM
ncbi:hypothetical protein MMC25_003713 [Agyrium rufum]|nr:hypothetical protein [Agyrium rufum]